MAASRYWRRWKWFVRVGPVLLTLLAAPANGFSQAQLPDTVYIWPMGNTAQNTMMSSLAGIVNRSTNGEVLLSPDAGTQPNPRYWLDRLQESYPQVQSQVQTDPLWYINRYKPRLSGYVRFDPANPASINVATSIAGVTDAIMVSDLGTQLTAVAAGLSEVADARTMTYAQAYAQYGPQFNRDMLFHQNPSFDHHLRDFAIMNRGFMYHSSPTALNPYASNQNPQGRIFGWAHSEFDLFQQASQANQQVVASDWSWSSSTTARWKVPVAGQKHHTPGSVATKTGKHYVAFVMSDGDNTQWLANEFATNPKWFGSPHRGKFDMTWDFSPSLTDVNPVAHSFYYDNASAGEHTDTFVAAGGRGTAFPSQSPDINGLALDIARSMADADLRVTSILDPVYDTSKLFPIIDQPAVDGIMFKHYADYYRGRGGAITWRNGKPIMSVKYSLWDDADSALEIANALNATTNLDPIDNSLSYTIVNVHPWSTRGPDGTAGTSGDPMSNVWQLVQWLDANKIEVVGLEELFVHLRNHFGTPLPGAVVNATWIRNSTTANRWSRRLNWTGAIPNFVNATVNLGSAISAARTLDVDVPVTAGTINFDSAFAYTLAGTNAITLDTSTGVAARINVTTGSHTVNAPLALADDTVIDIVPSAATLTVANLQPTSSSLTKAGAGALAVNHVRASGLNVSAGTVRMLPNGSAAGVSRVAGLSVAAGAQLDLNDNDLLVDYTGASVEEDVRRLVVHGQRDGWGIISTAGSLAGNRVLAIADNADLQYGQWRGEPIGVTTILGMYTYFGDANLDGRVTSDDYVAVDVGLGIGDDWIDGDFDMDGFVTSDDYVAIDVNLGQGTSTPAAFAELKAEMIALHTQMFGQAYVEKLALAQASGYAALVPEPGAAAILPTTLALASHRRRRRPPN